MFRRLFHQVSRGKLGVGADLILNPALVAIKFEHHNPGNLGRCFNGSPGIKQ